MGTSSFVIAEGLVFFSLNFLKKSPTRVEGRMGAQKSRHGSSDDGGGDDSEEEVWPHRSSRGQGLAPLVGAKHSSEAEEETMEGPPYRQLRKGP